jgi:hypothetical protein
MARYVVCPQKKKNISRIFKISGALIVKYAQLARASKKMIILFSVYSPDMPKRIPLRLGKNKQRAET